MSTREKNLDYQSFADQCRKFLFDEHLGKKIYRIYDSYIMRFAYGIDASCYRYIPKLVLKPINEEEVRQIILLSKKYQIPLTFRASGTSLSGQACSDSVLVVCMHKWQNIQAKSDSIWCDCGVIGIQANNALKPFGKKIGPDPATINNASIGGIFSNNSSGMCCGVKQNSYQTIKSVRIILSDGFILDTSDPKNMQEFLDTHQDMVSKLLSLRQEILDDEFLHKEIKRKFSIKNTTGYGLNSLSDFADIKDILNHIFIGAEGTLGFVSRVEYYTVKDYAIKACALLFYENLSLAAKAIEILAKNDDKVSAAEIMDYACLRAVKDLEGMPDILNKVEEGNCCILIQLESDDKTTLDSNLNFIKTQLDKVPTLFGIHFSFDKQEQDKWWKIRKGLLPISAGTKRKNSTVITEDICFEIKNFAKGIEGITKLFKRYGFEGIIFGHALSGNVHFIITPLLNDPKEREDFASFMDDMVKLVIDLKGSTKAEHGTGRMMAPFIELEWGQKAYEINKRIKNIFDSKNIFNPDVIICDDKQIHIKNLKPSHSIQDYLEACMECGFCEKVCPSRNLTLTPRQRIAVYREIKRLQSLDHKTKQEQEELESLKKDYNYFGIATCATCSMCSTICPLKIDTGKLAIELKNTTASKNATWVAKKIAKNMDKAIKVAKWSVGMANITANIISKDRFKKLTQMLNQSLSTPIVPKYMPTKNTYPLRSKNINANKSIIYLSSCLNRIFAPPKQAKDKRPIQEVFESLCKKANFNIIYPKNLSRMCCGKAFKDFSTKDSTLNPIHTTLKELLSLSNNGEIPIVCDHSACSGELIDQLKMLKEFEKLRVFDMSEFALKNILPNLKITPINEDIGIYAVCTCKKKGWADDIYHIAKACSNAHILYDDQTYCCGFAGNKGFTTPELNASALEGLQGYFNQNKTSRVYATSSTCEIGLSESTNRPWQHIIYLLDEVSTQ